MYHWRVVGSPHITKLDAEIFNISDFSVIKHLCDVSGVPLGLYMGVLGSTKERILKEIGKEPIHGYGLANRLGISLSSAYEHLKDLREGGFVELREEGRKRVYLLTDKGKHLLKAFE